MRKLIFLILVLTVSLGFSVPSTFAVKDPILFRGTVGEEIQYQKSIEAVSVSNGTVYAACDYRMVTGKELIGVYYLGLMGAYSTNGTRLWVNDSGYVVKIWPLKNGVLAGGLGGFVFLDNRGHIEATSPVSSKLYDFVLHDGYIYGVDGDIWYHNGTFSSSGEVFKARLLKNGSVEVKDEGWRLKLPSMPSRIRLGKVIYVGSGLPSGYSGNYQFGAVYGVSYGGRLLWNVSIGQWVRDLEVWRGNAIVGTGVNNTGGNILMIDEKGQILWNESTFFVEDLLVKGNTLYVSGIEGKEGKVAAYDLENKKLLWSLTLPYRAKVLAYGDGKLAVGIGKFESKEEGNVTRIYSEGGLYILNPDNGKILWEDSTMGYVRSLAVDGNLLVAGTGSSYFYVIDLKKVGESKGVCGPAAFLPLILLPLVFAVRGGRDESR